MYSMKLPVQSVLDSVLRMWDVSEFKSRLCNILLPWTYLRVNSGTCVGYCASIFVFSLKILGSINECNYNFMELEYYYNYVLHFHGQNMYIVACITTYHRPCKRKFYFFFVLEVSSTDLQLDLDPLNWVFPDHICNRYTKEVMRHRFQDLIR